MTNNNNNIEEIDQTKIADDGKNVAITYCLYETDKEQLVEPVESQDTKKPDPYRVELVWRNIGAMVFLHLAAIYGIYCLPNAKTVTILFSFLVAGLSTLGVQAGAHRLWSHRAYKANFGVRLFLAACHIMALQNDLYEWCRDHRAHHKFADTNGDPHNSSRGFFFSHVGWLMCKKHSEVKRRGATIDLSDLTADPIVRFQQMFYIPLVALIWGLFPTMVPVYFWGEDMTIAASICVFMRYALTLNITWLVNSWSHMYGYRPYSAKIASVESSCRHLLMGEGFHNYHHAFPWDYSASELGPLDVFNPTTAIINFFQRMGWAWDLKKVNKSLLNAKINSSGDSNVYHGIERKGFVYEWIGGLLLGYSSLWIALAIHFIGKRSSASTASSETHITRFVRQYLEL